MTFPLSIVQSLTNKIDFFAPISASNYPLTLGKIRINPDWLVWLLVLIAAGLVGIAILQLKRGNRLEKKTLEPTAEKTNLKSEETSKEANTLSQTQDGPAPRSQSQIDDHGNDWFHRVLGFIKRSSSAQTALEYLVLILGVFFFSQSFLDLNSTRELPGNEAQMFQALDWVFYHSVVQEHQFPIWNSWMRTGQPNIADPMFHSLNPVVGLPTLIFGVQDGFKIALFLSLLLAALGMHRLGIALGLNRVIRTWIALMFTFSGQPLAHVLQGQYLFIFGFAWIPWIIWGLYQLRHTRRLVYVALSALAMAFLILSGNSYYGLFLAFVVALFVIIAVLNIHHKRPYVQVDWKLLVSYISTASLAMGLVAVHLLPLFQFSSSLNKGIGIYGSHTPLQIIQDFTSKDTYRPDAYSDLPAREEYYAYIGWAPLILALFVPLAFRPGKRRIIIFGLLLLILVILWIDIKQMPWRSLYEQSRSLLQFRHILRPLVFGSFALWLLAGLVLDSLWQHLSKAILPEVSGHKVKRAAVMSVQGILVIMMLITFQDLYTTHKPFFQTEEACQRESEVMTLLREYDPGEYYTQFIPNNACLKPLLAAGARFLAPWYAWEDYRQLDGSLETRLVQAKQRYTIQPVNGPAPEGAIPTEIQTEAYRVYYHPDSLPAAFSVSNDVLEQQRSEAITVGEVSQQLPYFSGPNKVAVNAFSQAGERLVLLVTHDSGWRLYIDGKPAPVQKVSGYIATDMLPGTHQYQFVYQPPAYTLGLISSLVSLFLVFIIIIYDLRAEVAAWVQRMRSFWSTVRNIKLGELLANRKRQREKGGFTGGILVQSDTVYHHATESTEPSRSPYFELTNPLEMEDGRSLNLIVELPPLGADQNTAAVGISTAWRRWRWATGGMAQALLKSLSLGTVLFCAALVVYLLTRLIGLSEFPISFLGDEAVQTLYAETLIANKFHDPVTGLYLPIYVEAAGNRWTPLLPMYIHAATLTLFGKSVLVTRITSVTVGLLAAIAVGMILKQIYKVRLWWVGVLLVAITPAWFLHSRTAYETVMTTAFFAMFLWFYMRYRELGTSVIPVLVFCALTFYTYSNAQLIAIGAAFLLFLSDIRYHWQRRKDWLRAIPVAILVALPFILFTINKPAALSTHLRAVDSYWFHNIPVAEKVLTFLKNYFYGLSPAYWFFPNGVDLPRHRMLDIAHLPISMLLFMVIGLLLCLWRFRISRYRALILVGLAVPLGASLVQIGITRELAIIVPACLLMTLGIEWLWEQIRTRLSHPLPEWTVAIPVFLVLAVMSFGLLRTSLVNGPLWFDDYGLYGMQYGAIQIFVEAIPQYWRENPDLHFRISSVWANGTERYLSYFLSKEEQQKVDLISVEGLISKKYDLDPNDIFVLTPSEYDKAAENPKFKPVVVEKVIPYPNGSPGFYFVRVAYADNIDQLIEAESAVRKTLKEEIITLDGQPVTVRNSWLDMGIPAQIFDNDPFTLIRGMEANPFILELTFSEPHPIEKITLNLGAMDTDLTVDLYPQGSETPTRYQQSYRQVQEGDILRLKLSDGPFLVDKIYLEIYSVYAGEVANVHVRDLQLLP
jgi:hypothetical protein